jgi:electron transport complex protein RnfA
MLAHNSLLLIGAALLANFVAVQYLARPLTEWPMAVRTAFASVVVLLVAAPFNLLLEYFLGALNVAALQLLLSLTVVAALTEITANLAQNIGPNPGVVHRPLLLSHCALLNIALIEITRAFSAFDTTLYSSAVAVGFAVAILAFVALRQRSNTADVPAPLRGAAIDMLSAGLIALAFMGFTGIL